MLHICIGFAKFRCKPDYAFLRVSASYGINLVGNKHVLFVKRFNSIFAWLQSFRYTRDGAARYAAAFRFISRKWIYFYAK